MILKLQYFVFSTALVSKQKTEGNFMLGSWQGVNERKKVENPCSKCCHNAHTYYATAR